MEFRRPRRRHFWPFGAKTLTVSSVTISSGISCENHPYTSGNETFIRETCENDFCIFVGDKSHQVGTWVSDEQKKKEKQPVTSRWRTRTRGWGSEKNKWNKTRSKKEKTAAAQKRRRRTFPPVGGHWEARGHFCFAAAAVGKRNMATGECIYIYFFLLLLLAPWTKKLHFSGCLCYFHFFIFSFILFFFLQPLQVSVVGGLGFLRPLLLPPRSSEYVYEIKPSRGERRDDWRTKEAELMAAGTHTHTGMLLLLLKVKKKWMKRMKKWKKKMGKQQHRNPFVMRLENPTSAPPTHPFPRLFIFFCV